MPQLSNSQPILPTWREIVARLTRQRLTFGACFLLVILGFIVTGQFTHKYRTQMKLLVKRARVDPILTTNQVSTPDLQGLTVSEEEINSEAELLRGEDLLTKVVTEAGLASRNDPVVQARAVRKLQSKLEVSALAKTNLIAISYDSPSPKQSFQVIRAIQKLYPETQSETQQTNPEIKFLHGEVLERSSSLRQTEDNLTTFTDSTGIISAELQRDLAVHEMSELNKEEQDTSAQQADLQARIHQLNVELKSVPARMSTEFKTSDNPQLIGQLQSTLLNLRLKKQELDAKYQANNPLIEDVNAQIRIATAQLEQQQEPSSKNVEETSNVNPLFQDLKTQIDLAQVQLVGLNAKRSVIVVAEGQLNNKAMRYVAQDAQQQKLLGNVKDAQDEYRLYSDKLQQALVTQSLNKSGVLNVGVAEAPVYPALPQNSRLATLLAAIFAALVLSSGAALLADIFDPTVRTSRELAEALDAPVLAEFGRGFAVK